MVKKYSVLIGIVISSIIAAIAVAVYPGGSRVDQYSIGFSWAHNFISNLFAAKALNGAENASRVWASLAMVLFPISYAIFFIHMAKKIPDKIAGFILKYAGLANILFTFLTIIPPLHDSMLIVSTTLFWTGIIVITAIILKTKLRFFKFLCVTAVLVFYYGVYLWGTSNWELLPGIQKVNFIVPTLLILGLEYFTKKEDFAHIKTGKAKA
ncbi:hypothetical protein [Mucilaginibacter psychrotolerans]|uniref:DUF998 domain-containing protein n=1 Tax=Mucilaginibacter psychrotolerans TaxID=1524096 RepID=A0A4Y8RXP0_9SPHI|nr:hypothetical protein [Mucilaginibacter psychrotolerans]TFF30436.1 hypothetical protein E2R66_27305 [Mucilaginibacter psychrotolerans]